jgi:formylglycine-generating enzyme required for sulfatase activity
MMVKAPSFLWKRIALLIGLGMGVGTILVICLAVFLFVQYSEQIAAVPAAATFGAGWLFPGSTPTATSTATPAPTLTPTPTFTPSPTITPLPGSTQVSVVDGMMLVYIPAGEFKMGVEGGYDNGPAHSVYLDAFWIDQTEATNAMFARCVQSGKCSFDIRQADFIIHYNDPAYANHPVVYIIWEQAVNYCRWAGRRLPTEAEWEKAARGPDERAFPWGNEPASPKLLNFNNLIGDTTPVGSYPLGASPYGVLDMAGNVREWIADWYKALFYKNSIMRNPLGPETGDKRVLRGGAFDDPPNGVHTTTRYAHITDSAGVNRGFRCVWAP